MDKSEVISEENSEIYETEPSAKYEFEMTVNPRFAGNRSKENLLNLKELVHKLINVTTLKK